MPKHRSYPIEFKRQVAQEYLAGDTLHGLAKRHAISRNLVRIWVAKYETGSFDSDVVAADIVQMQEARIAAPERLVGKLALENEFLKGASSGTLRPRSETMSVVSGPVISPSVKDAG
jgi:transposase